VTSSSLQAKSGEDRLSEELGRLRHEVAKLNLELTETRQQQAATAEVLKAISGSNFDLQAVLTALTESAVHLCGASLGEIFRFDGACFQWAAGYALTPEFLATQREIIYRPGRDSTVGRTALNMRVTEIEDALEDPEYGYKDNARIGNFRTILGVPLLRSGKLIGVLGLARQRVEPFTEKQIELLTTFADHAVIAIENTRLFETLQARNGELTEALEQQTATGTILRAIASSPTDAKPVLNTVAESAARLCEAYDAVIFLTDGNRLAAHAHHGPIPLDIAGWPIERGWVSGRAYIDRKPVHVQDLALEKSEFPTSHAIAERVGFHTLLAVPMLREGDAIGVVAIRRREVRPFTQKQIDLLALFADQAAIAIENVRLFEELQSRNRELTEALEQQTATSTILRAIAASPTDVEPVLNTVVESATRLCGATFGQIFKWDGSHLRWAAGYGLSPEFLESQRDRVYQPGHQSLVARTALNMRVTVIDDALQDPDYAYKEHARIGNFRTMLGVPLLRAGELIGVLALVHQRVEPFTDKQIEMVTTFADQAVIAIENTRLFETLQARNSELTEALEQQTATATILRAIASSPTDLQPVLKTVAESATKLCEAYDAAILLAEGDELRVSAHHGPIPIDFEKWPINREFVTGRAYVDRKPIHVHDLLEEGNEYPVGQAMAKRYGHRTMLAVPLLCENGAIGTLIIRRLEVRPFTQKQVDLVVLFADQAAIAIENTRLFSELETRNRELTEALEQQTATGAILRAIAASPNDVRPVLSAVAQSAAKLCEAYDAAILLAEDTMLVLHAHHGPIPIDLTKWPIGRDWVTGRAFLDRKPVHVHDIMLEKDDFPASQTVAERLGFHTILAVPMLREDKAIGAVFIRRHEMRPFTQKQVDLLVLFADQAAIAIENTRLFEELQIRNRELTEANERQTATAEVLKAISRAAFDLPAVLRTLVASAARLCGANYGGIMLREGDKLRGRATYGVSPEVETELHNHAIPIDRSRISGRVVLSGRAEHIPDILADPEYDSPLLGVSNARALMGVPLLRKQNVEGVFYLGRPEPGLFASHQSDLVQTFADQAVIAIENVRLLEEVQARTRELEETLNYQTAIGEVLNVISRSPSDVQPVLDVILLTAVRLCDADGGTIARERNGQFTRSGQVGFSREFEELMEREPVEHSRTTITGRTLVEGKVVQILDAQNDPDYTWSEALRLGGLRTLLGVPLLRNETPIGVIALIRRTVRPFSQKQIELVTTFADQAVIAIENARLFEEVQARTSELAHSVEELQALGEVSQSVNSTLDLKTVLQTIVTKAVQLSRTDAGAIYVYSRQADRFRLKATYGMSDDLIAAISGQAIRLNDAGIGDAARSRQPIQTEDLAQNTPTPVHQIVLEAGFHSVLVVPLLRPNKVVGGLVVRRRAPGRFSESTVRLMETFAAQSVLAIQNARLFSEIEENGRQLEIASRHKSQFLANMSHELRTPLNSVLGFTEMLADGLYGELPEKAKVTLGRVEANGRHLLGLINDVLDLSKIEAGQLTLSLNDYSIAQIVKTVAATTDPLARAKGLTLAATVPEGLPLGRGDERRLHQVLLNLAGNAVKFTEKGAIEIAASTRDGAFEILVRDTGPGIALEHQTRIFEEFQQVDDSNTRQKGGTGLGLAISKRIVEMHGGSIGVESRPGSGSIFRVTIPIRAAEEVKAP
jgi:GAF domain-containing protein